MDSMGGDLDLPAMDDLDDDLDDDFQYEGDAPLPVKKKKTRKWKISELSKNDFEILSCVTFYGHV